MKFLRFRIRTLLIVTALAAIFTMPTYDYVCEVIAKNKHEQQGVTIRLPRLVSTRINTVVSVPDGGTILIGGIKRQAQPIEQNIVD